MQLKVGDRLRLPATLSQPGGEYRVVAIKDDMVEFRSSKDNVTRFVKLDDVPALLERLTPTATTPITSESFGRDHGVLSQMGYRVGAHAALPAINRQIALRRVFTTLAKDLPVGTDEPYRVEWGEAGTEARFAKMRRCLESFVDLHLKHPPEYRRSIAEWRDDLRWLEREVGEPNGFPSHHTLWLSIDS